MIAHNRRLTYEGHAYMQERQTAPGWSPEEAAAAKTMLRQDELVDPFMPEPARRRAHEHANLFERRKNRTLRAQERRERGRESAFKKRPADETDFARLAAAIQARPPLRREVVNDIEQYGSYTWRLDNDILDRIEYVEFVPDSMPLVDELMGE